MALGRTAKLLAAQGYGELAVEFARLAADVGLRGPDEAIERLCQRTSSDALRFTATLLGIYAAHGGKVLPALEQRAENLRLLLEARKEAEGAVNDAKLAGLAAGTATCQYSTNGGSSWTTCPNLTATFDDGSTSVETIEAPAVPFNQDSETDNVVRFSVEDRAGRSNTFTHIVKVNTDAPGGWSDLNPTGWIADQTPTLSVQVRDEAPGLDVGSAVCEYTTDGWSSWNTVPCTCSGQNYTTDPQTITAAAVPFNQDSDTLNWVKFSISDTSGYRGDSPSYPVHIDTTEPEAQISAPRRVTTPTIPITWTASDTLSGVAGYDVQVRVDGGGWSGWLTNTTQTQAGYEGQPGHAYSFRVRATDNVGNPGDWVEATTAVAQVTTYYHFNGQRIAMRQGSVVYYLHSDHLGSTSLATTAGGAVHSRQGYYPYGSPRYSEGTLPTDLTFTGQREEMGLGLMDFKARMYSPLLGRFVSADTVVPDPPNPQVLNRYSYAANNPVKFIDPNGHQIEPPENCGVLCYTGTLGPYNNQIDMSWTVASPAVQPLTTAGYHSASDTYISAANLPADAGVLLTYEIPGYLHRRQELLVCSADLKFGVGKVGAEFKNVKIYDGLLSDRKIGEYEEWSFPVAYGPAAPVVGGLSLGVEYSTWEGGAPFVQGEVLGADLILKPGEIMVGWQHDAGAGYAVGVEWQRDSTIRLLTSWDYYSKVGANKIGEKYAPGGRVVDMNINRGYWNSNRHRWVSGLETQRTYLSIMGRHYGWNWREVPE
ncbi:MAG: RHS repeat-associated core domain-containing protein [Chloroflexota bacterium]